MRNCLPALVVVSLVLSFAGCRRKTDTLPPPPSAPAPPPQATPQRSDAACAASFDAPGSREKIRAPSGEVRIGILAGLKDADDENLAHLRRLVAELRTRNADVLIANGDLGDNSDEQETLLGALSESGLPVLAVAGNREERSDLDAAEAELRKRGARLVDLSHTRIADLGDAVVVAVPGAFERRQLHSDGACLYVQRDLDNVAAALERLTSGPPAVLVAAVPPRGKDRAALDVSDGQNVGDPRLAPLLKRAPFGVFGQVWESGGRAIDGDGRPVAPGTEVERLYLNPGAADRTPWPMADGAISSGRAALLVVKGRRAVWEQIRAGAG